MSEPIKLPEAFRLADTPFALRDGRWNFDADDELRRLHVEVERLREVARERGNRVIRKDKAIDALKDRNNGLKELIRTHRAEVERLRAECDEARVERDALVAATGSALVLEAIQIIRSDKAEVERLRAALDVMTAAFDRNDVTAYNWAAIRKARAALKEPK